MGLVLHGIYCRDFGSYRGEHTLHFRKEPGLYFVHGENRVDTELGSNDAGKTTLFSLIAWVIYGKTLRDERPGSSVETWNKTGPTLGGLTFQWDDNYFRIERARNPNKLRIKENANDWQDCDQAHIEAIWPLSFDAFKCTIVLPQLLGEARPFLDLRPEEQSELISVGLNVWLEAAAKAGTLAKDAAADLDARVQEISRCEGAMGELRRQIGTTNKAFEEFEADILVQHREVARKIKELEDETIELQRKVKPLPKDTETEKLEAMLREVEKNMADRDALQRETEAEAANLKLAIDDCSYASQKYEAKKCPECGQQVTPTMAKAKLAKLNKDREELNKKANAVLDTLEELQTIDFEPEWGRLSETISESKAGYNQRTLAQQGLIRRLERVHDEKGDLYAERKKLETQANPHKRTLTDLRKHLADASRNLIAKRKEKTGLEEACAAYGYWRDAFRTIRLDLIDECLRGLEGLANQAAEQMGLQGWRIEMATEQETTQGKIVRKMSVFLYPPGQSEPVRWQAYGGGVSQRWQLAVRFALSELLLAACGLTPSIEILDEPTAHLSQEGIEALMLYLRERSKRLNREIWVVEHSPLDESLFDATLNVVKTVQGSKAQWNDDYEPLKDWDPDAEPWLTVTPEGI